MPASAESLPRVLSEVVSRGDFKVPPYPAAALRLRRIIEKDNFGLSEVADAASADPALAAALLRVANSALYHGSGPAITTLGRAVHRLGARSVAAIAAAAALGAESTAVGPLIDVKYRVWRRSVTCALACQSLAKSRGLDPDEGFLAGLLHGFGRSVALACLERLLATLPLQSMSLMEWMQAVEPHRAELARQVAKQWELPEAIATVIGSDAGSPGASLPLHGLVALAERIAGALEHGASSEQVCVEAGITQSERRALDKFIDGLPGALEALVLPPEASKRPRGLNAVNKPTTALSAERSAASISVSDLRVRREPVPLTAVCVSVDGLVIDSPRPMQESCVARLSLGVGAEAIEGWFSVVLCVPEHGRFRIEVQAFAPSRELRQFLADAATRSAGATPPRPQKAL